MDTYSQRRRIRVDQRGVTLVEFMVGMAVGLLVTLAAVGSIVVTRNSARNMTDRTALEQQASLVMAQIGQQIVQAGAINAYVAGTDPNEGVYDPDDKGVKPITTGGGANLKITFDTRDMGLGKVIGESKGQGANVDWDKLPVFGTAGHDTTPDTLIISYAQPNDNGSEKVSNCIGSEPETLTKDGIPRVVNILDVDVKDESLKCYNGKKTSRTQPIASNVIDMRIRYLLPDPASSDPLNRGLLSQTADRVTQNKAWLNVVGLQVCLEMRSDPTQAPEQDYTGQKDCQGNTLTKKFTDGRLHLFVRQTFYLRNNLG